MIDWFPIRLSFAVASAATLIALVAGSVIAWLLARKRFPGRDLLDALITLPLVLPPTVLGFYILVAIGPHSPLGRVYNELVGHPLPFTFEGLLLASVLYSLPFAVQPFAAAFEQVDRRLIEASWTLGVSKLGTFFKLIVPLSKAGLLTGAVLSFAHTMGEFGVVLMVGGNLEGETRTVSIDIYDEVQALNYAGAAKTALFLLVVSYAVLLLVYAVNRNVWAAWPQK